MPLVLLSLLLAASPAAPTLGTLRALPPEAAGRALLEGRDHGPVETVAPAPVPGMSPPGMVRLDLIEKPVAAAGGCVRRRWTASFFQLPGSPEAAATLTGIAGQTEVALAAPGGCSGARYAEADPQFGAGPAIAALAFLAELRAGRKRIAFACSDGTGTDLCRSDETMRRELRRLSPWAVVRREGGTEIWLGERGQVVTSLRYSGERPDRVRLERAIPAPF